MSRGRSVFLFLSLCTCALLVLPVCSGGGSSGGGSGMGQSQFRAIAGVSMGGYGALNLGTKHPDLFGTIGSLGGPVDLRQLLIDIRDENLEVKRQVGPIPMAVGEDFTFDLLPPYPDRETRIGFTKDLVLAFGNPTLHHPDPGMAYLASDSEPAMILMDDQWGSFTIPTDPRGFLDGADENGDGLRQVGTESFANEPTDALLLAGGTLSSVFGETGTDIGGRRLIDTNADNVYDLGDGIVVNMSEPFTDTNMNGVWDSGEPFSDTGLDGVSGTDDLGEENSAFDEDPDIVDHWLPEDPLTRIAGMTSQQIGSQRIYMDAGTGDELGFFAHYQNLVGVIEGKGVDVVEEDFDGSSLGDCLDVPNIDAPYFLLRYEGNHVGFDDEALRDDLQDFDINVCNNVLIWQRILHLLAAMDAAFPGGVYGPGGFTPGDVVDTEIASPALAVGDGPAPLRPVLVYRPPAYHNSSVNLPIVYFLGGHGQAPEDYEQIRFLMDALILDREIQNMFLAFLPGAGGTEGSFYVNHAVSESQVPDLTEAEITSGRYEDSIVEDLIPAIEQGILGNRVR